MTTPIPSFLVTQTDDDVQSHPVTLKRKRLDSNDDDVDPSKKPTETHSLLRHFAHVCCVNIDETILENAEISGTNLAVKLMQMGADSILEEIRHNTPIIPLQ